MQPSRVDAAEAALRVATHLSGFIFSKNKIVPLKSIQKVFDPLRVRSSVKFRILQLEEQTLAQYDIKLETEHTESHISRANNCMQYRRWRGKHDQHSQAMILLSTFIYRAVFISRCQ